jgi:hypothetical protein
VSDIPDLWADVAAVLPVALWVNRARFLQGPGVLIPILRAQGARARRRDSNARRRLRKVIGFVDRCFPSGRNCYRRTLIEIAVDAGAAEEPVHFGLKAHAAPASGHAWLGEMDAPATDYEVQLDI